MTHRAVLIPEQPDLPYRTGRHVEHDEASKGFRARAAAPLRSKMHRRWGRLLDQDGVGACTYFGLLNALHHRPLYRRGQQFTNDDGFAGYAEATAIDEFPGAWQVAEPHGEDTGSSGLAACKVAKAKGLISRYEWGFGFEDVKRLAVETVVMVGTVWRESMFDVPPSGILDVEGEVVSGHEYLVTGIDVERELVRIHCAWRRWGVNGQQWAWLRWAKAAELLEDMGDAVVPRR